MKISNSRFSLYLRCPYAHYLRYYEGLAEKLKGRPLSFGSDMHKLLQHRNDPKQLKQARKEIGEYFYNLPEAQQAKLGGDDYIVDLQSIFFDYQNLYADHRQPKYTERKFKVKVATYRGEPIIFNGIIDEIYKIKTRRPKTYRVIIGEHKTFSRKPDLSALTMNIQKNLYAKAYYFKTGILPDEVIWDHICSNPAQEPVYLVQSGRFSKAATKKVTPQSFLRACERLEITDPKVLAQADEYKNNISEFFFKTPQDVIPEAVDAIWDDFLYVSRDIVRQGHKNKVRNITRDCGWCEFRSVCNAELSGNDANYIKEQFYTQREREEEDGTE